MIDIQRVEKCIEYLASTDEEHAEARADVKELEQRRKTIKALAFSQAEGTVQARESYAYSCKEYQDHLVEYREAVLNEQKLSNKRQRAILTIDVWRSLNANRRNGNV